MYDYVIIGAGVTGCSIARELSRYKVEVCILEKNDDVASGASKANSGIIHGGYAAKYGTLKGKLNVLGNKQFNKLNMELNFGYRKTGGLVLAFNDEEYKSLKSLYENGIKNGVKDLKIIGKDEILKIEPNLNPDVMYALYAGDVGVTSPYEYTIALAENAISNGAELFLNNEVLDIIKKDGSFDIVTSCNIFSARTVINASGVYSDSVSKMAGIESFKINPRKGQYILFQKGTGSVVNTVVFQVPTNKGKGILVTSTFHGNLMLGPNSEEVSNREDKETDEISLKYVIDTARKSLPKFDLNKQLKTFSGIRPTSDNGDFIIREEYPGFINVAGIESPGLTSSPAIADMVIDIIARSNNMEKKSNFNPYREAIIKPKQKLEPNEIKRRVDLETGGDRIVCRCERVTEAEIKDALSRNIKIDSIKAVKMRTRAGMGFCQGKFCGPRVQKLLSK